MGWGTPSRNPAAAGPRRGPQKRPNPEPEKPQGWGFGVVDSTARGPPEKSGRLTLPGPQLRYGARPKACPERLERPCVGSAALSPV